MPRAAERSIRGDAMTDYPDIYADSAQLTSGTYGFTLTLRLSDPTDAPGQEQAPSHIVGRVRMSPQLAGTIAGIIQQALASMAAATAQPVNERPA
jgi:hypothetical protein